jgi:hypothetical protein
MPELTNTRLTNYLNLKYVVIKFVVLSVGTISDQTLVRDFWLNLGPKYLKGLGTSSSPNAPLNY